MKFWNSYRNHLVEQQVAKVVFEWLFFVVMFSVVSNVVYDGDNITFATMLASYALLVSISNQRKLKRAESIQLG